MAKRRVVQHVLLGLAVVGWLGLSWTRVASAENPSEQNNLFELGVYIGALFPSDKHELYAFPSVEHKEFKDAAVDFGARIGYLPWSWIGIEVEGGAMPTSTNISDSEATIYTARGHLLLQYPSIVCPFVVGGGGLLAVRSSKSAVGNNMDAAGYWGGGLKWYASSSVAVRVDARHVMANGLGTDTVSHNFEVLGGLSWVIGWTDKEQPPTDSDGDGLADDQDRCPNEPAKTSDGCPLPADQDGDGVPDEKDRCPTKPANTADGCPPDGDGDGVADADDACPNTPGTVEAKGCPPDKDNDGIVDADDQCPSEPETKNGFEDQDGCTDELPKQVKRFTGAIKGINFALGSAEIRSSSYDLLNKAVSVLKEYPNLKLIIRGHSDSTGTRDLNMRLSGDRAQAVVTYFVGKGIDQERLTSEGLGPDEPIADNKTTEGRAQNRRIEFKIVTE